MWMVVTAAVVALVAVGVAVAAATVAAHRGQQASAAAAAAARYRTVLDHALVGIAVLAPGPGGRWVVREPNPALGHLLRRDVAGAVWSDLLGPQEAPDAVGTLDALAGGRLAAWHGEHLVEVGGRTRSMHVSLAPLPATGPGPRQVGVQVVDVTDRVSEQRRLRDLALHDALTGLPNRTLLADRLDLALAGTKRTGARVLVAFCDLDDFKAVNDGAGHAAGDQVLVTVAHRLREAVRPADTVARVGGDEFVVLCPDVPDEVVATDIAGRLLAALRAPVQVDGEAVGSGGSVGVALSAAGRGTDASSLLQAADVAMYRAKRLGKDAAHLLTLADDEDVFVDAPARSADRHEPEIRPVPAGRSSVSR